VDDSIPSAVTFTATRAFASANDSTISSSDGVDLLTFFASDVGSGPFGLGTGDLAPSVSGLMYNTWSGDKHSSSSYLDLNLYQTRGSATQVFTTSAPAFAGSFTADFSSVSFALPSPGSTGNIMTGWAGHPGVVIGTYMVVPEPSHVGATMAAGLALFGISRLRSFNAVSRNHAVGSVVLA
jgi:hypothetical protein